MDRAAVQRENDRVLPPGGSRRRIAQVLSAAYAGGLLSEDTFVSRTEHVLSSRLLDPRPVVGDLNLRAASRSRSKVHALVRAVAARLSRDSPVPTRSVLLALDWTGAQTELLLGRHQACDVVLSDLSVSRKHARLIYRDEKWILQDLRSTNGTVVNGTRIGRCELRPGDHLMLGDESLKIDDMPLRLVLSASACVSAGRTPEAASSRRM
jgi:hypothetical protein